MTNIEIEDVLSSIRRLVSEDSSAERAKTRPKPLMLTPAFRIAEQDTDRTNRAGGMAQADAGDDQSGAEARGVAGAADAIPSAQDAPVAAADDTAGPQAANGPEDDVGPSDADDDALVDADEEAFLAESEAEGAGRDFGWSAEDDQQTTAEEGEGEGADDFADADPAELAESDQAEADEAGTDEATAEFFSTREDMSLEDRIADLEAAIGQSDDEFEPDGSEDQATHIPRSVLRPAAGTAAAEAWEPRVEPPVGDLPKRVAAAADFDDEELEDLDPPVRALGARDDDGEAEEALIDEDSLREIVADLVRQELRGELGERITRNVRRLIRREIHRALALQELEDED